jgi:hypothetical protein
VRRRVLIFGSNLKKKISITGRLLKDADKAAPVAVGDFLEQQQCVLLRLNEVYANGPEPGEKGLQKRIMAKVKTAVKKRW